MGFCARVMSWGPQCSTWAYGFLVLQQKYSCAAAKIGFGSHDVVVLCCRKNTANLCLLPASSRVCGCRCISCRDDKGNATA